MWDRQIGNGAPATRRTLVVDGNGLRRRRLSQGTRSGQVVEAASLSDAFAVAEECAPKTFAICANFAREPDFEGFLRLVDALDARAFLYGEAPEPPSLRRSLTRLPYAQLGSRDDLDSLLARISDAAIRTERPTDAGTRTSLGAAGRAAPEIVLIGASTGGIAALETVLRSFPTQCPPTLVVQHIRDGFVPGLVRRLDRFCRPHVTEARDGAALKPGTVHIAGDTSLHLCMAGKAVLRIRLHDAPLRNGHRPSVDALFASAVFRGDRIAAAQLTGMGADGAEGLELLRKAGAYTVAQDRETSTVWGMPRAAVEAGAAVAVLPLSRIAQALLTGWSADAPRSADGVTQ